jgi:hypothetical protein
MLMDEPARIVNCERPLRVELQPDDVLLYVHVPKTGGTSLISILEAQFADHEVLPLHSPIQEEYFWSFSQRELKSFRFVRGHYRVGPYDRHIYKHVVQNPYCITMLRDPIERIISEYRHISRTSHHPLHKRLVSYEKPLRAFLTQPQFQGWIQDRVARQIFGFYPGWPWDPSKPRTISDEALRIFAKQRLEQFAVVGLTERFDESVQLLCYTFGWEVPSEIPRLNVATDSFSRGPVDDEIRRLLKEKTSLDHELYRHAQALFEIRLRKMKEELQGLRKHGQARYASGHRAAS